MPEKMKPVPVEEITKHSTPDDCWIVVDGRVWDMTDFTPDHPGGPAIIYKHAGRDATESYSSIHAPSILPENLDPSKLIGELDKSTVTHDWAKPPPDKTPELALNEKPPLETIVNARDFDDVASRVLSKKTYAFYSSAATDLNTKRANEEMLARIWFRPRLMRNVATVDTRSKILGHDVSLPLFVSPAALAKLADPDGEKAMARACVSRNIVQAISSNASFPFTDIIAETPPLHPTVYQLYVNRDRAKTEALLRALLQHRPRIRAIMITIDAPVPGKREADERLRADESLTIPTTGRTPRNDAKGGGLGRTSGAYIDDGLAWADIPWIRRLVGPDMPLMVKGVQSARDAVRAADAGLQGIVVSNHGGRCLDGTPPSVLVLLELWRCAPGVFGRLDVWVDGGVRRGADVVKCLALGASAVGLGRSFLYALAYGQAGCEKLVDILKDEVETTMKLVGINRLSECHGGLVNTRDVDHLVPTDMGGHPYVKNSAQAKL